MSRKSEGETTTRGNRKVLTRIPRGMEKSMPTLARLRTGQGDRFYPRDFIAKESALSAEFKAELADVDDSKLNLDISDLFIDPPAVEITKEIDKRTKQILDSIESPECKDSRALALEMAFAEELKTYDELCAPFLHLQDKYLRECILKRKAKNFFDLRNKNCLYDSVISNRVQEVTHQKGECPMAPDEILIRVGIFDVKSKSQSHEFFVLGSSFLTDLRDTFVCMSDSILGDEVSTSSCFVIEDVIYDDIRIVESFDQEGNLDLSKSYPNPARYSTEIINWVKENKRFTQPGLTRFQQDNMHSTQFKDLHLRLGSLYWFLHKGDCWHGLCFLEVRKVSPEDFSNAFVYPLLIYRPKTKRVRCQVCECYDARYAVYEDEHTPQSPYMFCQDCFDHFYEKDSKGQLIRTDLKYFKCFQD